MSPQKETPAATEAGSEAQQFNRIEEFSEDYANSVRYEISNWDLKLIFGELAQHLGPNAVIQHTAITIPWAQVKLMIYFMSINLALHEGQSGRVTIAKGLIKEAEKQMPKELKDVGTPAETWERIRKLYEDFINTNPESAPE